ncbi:hypothetical protein LX36DRAFT_442684 [Colletotrichum falcatum]|nr:hypothetical protein LX36DRAFT_442684 [Colletotrichum falcatum]
MWAGPGAPPWCFFPNRLCFYFFTIEGCCDFTFAHCCWTAGKEESPRFCRLAVTKRPIHIHTYYPSPVAARGAKLLAYDGHRSPVTSRRT